MQSRSTVLALVLALVVTLATSTLAQDTITGYDLSATVATDGVISFTVISTGDTYTLFPIMLSELTASGDVIRFVNITDDTFNINVAGPDNQFGLGSTAVDIQGQLLANDTNGGGNIGISVDVFNNATVSEIGEDFTLPNVNNDQFALTNGTSVLSISVGYTSADFAAGTTRLRFQLAISGPSTSVRQSGNTFEFEASNVNITTAPIDSSGSVTPVTSIDQVTATSAILTIEYTAGGPTSNIYMVFAAHANDFGDNGSSGALSSFVGAALKHLLAFF